MASFTKDKRETEKWLQNPTYSKEKSQSSAIYSQSTIAEQAKTASQSNFIQSRSNSLENIRSVLRNPYELSQGDIRALLKLGHNRTYERDSDVPRGGAKSVPFGTGQKRGIGSMSLKEMVQYTYLPDLKQLNAEREVQLREEREAER